MIYYFPWCCGLGFLRAWLGVLFQVAPPGDTPLQLVGGCYLVWKIQEISLRVYGTSLLFHMAVRYHWLLCPHSMAISGWLDFFPKGQAPRYKCLSRLFLTTLMSPWPKQVTWPHPDSRWKGQHRDVNTKFIGSLGTTNIAIYHVLVLPLSPSLSMYSMSVNFHMENTKTVQVTMFLSYPLTVYFWRLYLLGSTAATNRNM